MGDGEELKSQRSVKIIKELQDMIPSRLRNLVFSFIEALEGLTAVHHYCKDFAADARTLLAKKQYQEARELYLKFKHQRLNLVREYVGRDVGIKNRKFIQKYKAVFTNAFGSDGKKLLKMDYHGFISAFRKLGIVDDKKTGRVQLENYSEYLTKFRNLNNKSFRLEIPGQYDQENQPIPEKHSIIVSFDKLIRTMSSLRKPKKLTIYGDDEKAYDFLVKGGEDLRLDQRIQQIFRTMNGVLSSDQSCSSKGLSLKTYKVIPLNGRVGILEWVPNTIPIKSVVNRQLRSRGLKDINYMAMRYKQYFSERASKQDPRGFTKAISNSAKEKKLSIENFRAVQAKFPPDLLLKGISSLGHSIESFIKLRNRFAKSFATFNICSYILGIGDRHLDNWLVDESDGSIIGIDFGMSFGLGITLGVPELTPFRFTRQFQNLLQPLDRTVYLKQMMINVMRSLRSEKDLILTILSIFVKEPHLDWITQSAKETSSTDGQAVKWYADRKIATVRKKLMGAYPASVMYSELRYTSHKSKPKFFDACKNLILGDKKGIRYPRTRMTKSVEHQVDCLIDQATDEHILSLCWTGWGSFV